jgi:hypothetical protein
LQGQLAWIAIVLSNPTVLIVIASYYVLFAVMGGTTHALIVE